MHGGRKPITREQAVRGARLGAKLQAERERRGLSQQEVADRARLAYATVRKIESGATANPGILTVVDIARVVGIPLDDLIRRPGRPRRS